MKTFVLISAIIELLAGAVMLLMPTLIPDLKNGDASDLNLARMYGAAAVAVGYFCLQVWQHFDSVHLRNAFLKTMSVFHIGVATVTFVGFISGLSADPSVPILHVILAAITIYYFFKSPKQS